MEEERERAERRVRSAAAAVAGSACAMAEEFVARSKKTSGRVADLQATVEVWCYVGSPFFPHVV